MTNPTLFMAKKRLSALSGRRLALATSHAESREYGERYRGGLSRLRWRGDQLFRDLLRHLELRDLLCLDTNGLASLRVPPIARIARVDVEHAESSKFDSLSTTQAHRNRV
jgi:hypothetical protein